MTKDKWYHLIVGSVLGVIFIYFHAPFWTATGLVLLIQVVWELAGVRHYFKSQNIANNFRARDQQTTIVFWQFLRTTLKANMLRDSIQDTVAALAGCWITYTVVTLLGIL